MALTGVVSNTGYPPGSSYPVTVQQKWNGNGNSQRMGLRMCSWEMGMRNVQLGKHQQKQISFLDAVLDCCV